MCYVCVSEERELSTAHSQERDCSRSQSACRSFFLSVEKQAQNKNSVYRWPGESLAVAHVLGRDLADGVVRVRDGCGLWGPGHSGILSYRSPLAWVAARPRAAELVLDYRQSFRWSSCRLKSLVNSRLEEASLEVFDLAQIITLVRAQDFK